jgi:hypothetical protein
MNVLLMWLRLTNVILEPKALLRLRLQIARSHGLGLRPTNARLAIRSLRQVKTVVKKVLKIVIASKAIQHLAIIAKVDVIHYVEKQSLAKSSKRSFRSLWAISSRFRRSTVP